MIRRILVAVDDSAAALAAASFAIELAAAWSAELNVVTIDDSPTEGADVLRHVAAMAESEGVTIITTVATGGPAFEAILDTAHTWQADVVVMGRSDDRRPGRPYVGSQTEHVLEFTDIPVLVVPSPLAGRSS